MFCNKAPCFPSLSCMSLNVAKSWRGLMTGNGELASHGGGVGGLYLSPWGVIVPWQRACREADIVTLMWIWFN
jgi:hypothetical protein